MMNPHLLVFGSTNLILPSILLLLLPDDAGDIPSTRRQSIRISITIKSVKRNVPDPQRKLTGWTKAL
jgi:hypothetical protein